MINDQKIYAILETFKIHLLTLLLSPSFSFNNYYYYFMVLNYLYFMKFDIVGVVLVDV